jgi:polar amino acid transport system substrate-binding protein
MQPRQIVFSLGLTASLVLAACASATSAPPTQAPATAVVAAPTNAPTAAPAAAGLLDDIQKRGYMLISNDPNYAPQSVLKKDGKRNAGTKCPTDAFTTGEMEGFDVDVAAGVSKAIGVEACFVTPDWNVITAGNWGDKWDVSIGSMTITTERQKALVFTAPYYFTPAQVAAAKDAGITAVADLAGKPVCVGTGTTYEAWLNGQLGIPATDIKAQPPASVKVVSLATDQECPQSIAAGRKDFQAFVTSATVVDQDIKAGLPVVKVGAPVFVENLAIAIDKSHKLDSTSLVQKLSDAINAMHADGTLTKLSMQWFGADLTQGQ